MAEVKTDKPINIAQLTAEMGGVPLHSIGPRPDGSTTVRNLRPEDDNQAALDAAVAAHVEDPEWRTPALVAAEQARAGREQRRASLDAGLRGYLAAPSPSPAQTAEQVKALIRLALDLLDE